MVNYVGSRDDGLVVRYKTGALAQLGARLNGIQKAVGSNPICSIICGNEGSVD